MKAVSLYARVSSRKQAQKGTIESQVDELEHRISEDEHELLDEYRFIDNGYSGANLERPGLDRLRDKVKEGKIDDVVKEKIKEKLYTKEVAIFRGFEARNINKSGQMYTQKNE